MFGRSRVANQQAQAIAADTGPRRAARTAGSRSIGTARDTVVPPATGEAQKIIASTHVTGRP